MFKLTGILVKFYTTPEALAGLSEDAAELLQEREKAIMYGFIVGDKLID